MTGIYFVHIIDAKPEKLGRVVIAVMPYASAAIEKILRLHGISFEKHNAQVHTDWVSRRAFVIHPGTNECFYINSVNDLQTQGFSLLTQVTSDEKF